MELEDIKAVVLKLKVAGLGDSFDAFCARKSNRFVGDVAEARTRSGNVTDVGGPAKPWKNVQKVRESGELKQYVQQALINAPKILPADV